MSARDEILAAVRAARPPHVARPDETGGASTIRPGNPSVLIADFIASLEATGGRIIRVAGEAEASAQTRALAEGRRHVTAPVGDGAGDLADVEVAIVRSRLGVAENGAVWLSESDLGARVLPVITQTLVVVLEAATIVPTMHEAYAAIEGEMAGEMAGFGQFVAGPSKTADIEQSLVVGAHGAKAMVVVLVG